MPTLGVDVEPMVFPERRQGDVVFWDNLGAHKRVSVRALIENAGASVVFVPPYARDTNSIELAWSKVKMSLCTHAARTWETLVDAVADALSPIGTSDIGHGFEKGGGHAQQQEKRL